MKSGGYTLYAEEIIRPLDGKGASNLIGHTIYKAPTLSTAAFNTTSVVTQPKRQGLVLCEYYNTETGSLSRGKMALILSTAAFGGANENFEKASRRGESLSEQTEEKSYSIREIIGDSGANYGIGVKLDSELLTNLSERERIQMVKEYVKELGGNEFSAFDKNGKEVSVRIAESNRRFVNKKGKKVRVNKDLSEKYIGNKVKQEAIALVDELIATSKPDPVKPSRYTHGWLDNNGKNDWDYWTTFIQDKENTVWKATLNIANTAYGEKILYDINKIEMVEQSVKSDTIFTVDSIAQKDPTVNTIISENVDKNSTKSVTHKKVPESKLNSARDTLEERTEKANEASLMPPEGVYLYDERDFVTDDEVAKTGRSAAKAPRRNEMHTLFEITVEQNRDISRLNRYDDNYRGKFTGGKQYIYSTFRNKHILKRNPKY